MLSEAILKPLRSGNLLLTVFSIDSPTSVPGKCQSLLKIKFLKSLARTADPCPHTTPRVFKDSFVGNGCLMKVRLESRQ